MFATSTISRAIFLVLAACVIGNSPTHAQSAPPYFNHPSATGSRIGLGAWPAKCVSFPLHALAAARSSEGNESLAVAAWTDPNFAGVRNAACVDSTFSAAPSLPRDNPCRADTLKISATPYIAPCDLIPDTIPAKLSALGKPGLKIARAREKVLDILRSENACTEWFATKDRVPAETFQSIGFVLDSHGPPDISATIVGQSTLMMRQPYVARATQDGGASTTIMINAYGAFYRTQGQIQKTAAEGGPAQLEGTHVLTVGSYTGNTLAAQVVTLLHEFGHIIDLLPEDADNLDGKSVRNTDEVLRHCRVEIEARAKQSR
jgi:hypothetical protein